MIDFQWLPLSGTAHPDPQTLRFIDDHANPHFPENSNRD
jgi:hypothetical protein